jgi:excinuclease ABC subunit C
MLRKILTKTPKFPITRSSFSSLPEQAGVYVFLKHSRPLYVGKAINLRARLKSYLVTGVGDKTKAMLGQAEEVTYLLVENELEALLLEADMIRGLQPPYNTISKDDKHPLYIKITKELYPRVVTARKIDDDKNTLAFFGPFPSTFNVRSVLRHLRRIIPFSDHKIGRRKCIYAHIGLCNPCPSVIESLKDSSEKDHLGRQYKKNIRLLINILSRRSDKVLKDLKRTMAQLSKSEKFEEAAAVREKVRRLEYIIQPTTSTDSFLENPNLLEDIREEELLALRNLLLGNISLSGKIRRIECYDVAHLAGTYPTASMVTFIDGVPEKTLYRHYRIRQKKAQDDISSMREVARRRLKTIKLWGAADLVVVDGGKTQSRVFFEAFSKAKIPIIGLAKKLETLIIPKEENGVITYVSIRPGGPALNLLQRLRDEAHRFARRYHHHLLKKNLVS